MPEFTKGKWYFLEWPISSDKEEKRKYLIGSPERAVGFIFHEADARLIAAAPDMYELLYEAMQDLQHYETKLSYKKTMWELIQEELDSINGKGQY